MENNMIINNQNPINFDYDMIKKTITEIIELNDLFIKDDHDGGMTDEVKDIIKKYINALDVYIIYIKSKVFLKGHFEYCKYTIFIGRLVSSLTLLYNTLKSFLDFTNEIGYIYINKHLICSQIENISCEISELIDICRWDFPTK